MRVKWNWTARFSARLAEKSGIGQTLRSVWIVLRKKFAQLERDVDVEIIRSRNIPLALNADEDSAPMPDRDKQDRANDDHLLDMAQKGL